MSVCGRCKQPLPGDEPCFEMSDGSVTHIVCTLPTCAYCGQPDGYHGRHLVLKPIQYIEPMHQECMDDIARWGCD